MKTSEHGSKYERYIHRDDYIGYRDRKEDFGEFNPDLNEERIISSYKPKEKVYFYDNSLISLSYGQYNVEKCLVVLFILIVYTAILIYDYYPLLSNFSFILLVSSGSVDIIISFLYLYFLLKLKSDQIFNKIPNAAVNSSDILIIANLVAKILTLVMIIVDYSILGLTAIILFVMKFLIEFYFNVISVKLFMFCPCTLYIQEKTEKVWNWIKYYVFCCEIEEPENPDYTKIEDLESFY